MDNPVLKTSADDLFELVRSRKKISVEDAAKLLKLTPETVQSLVDFLVEEKVFGIEYKFTTPYVYIQNEDKKFDFQGKFTKKIISKDEFFQKSGGWGMSPEKVNELWKKYLKENLENIKEVFYIKSNSRSIPKEQIDKLWKKYWDYLQ